MISVTRSLQKITNMCPKISKIGSVDHLGPHYGAMGGPGESRCSFVDDSDRYRVSPVDPPGTLSLRTSIGPCFHWRPASVTGAAGAGIRAGRAALRAAPGQGFFDDLADPRQITFVIYPAITKMQRKYKGN